MDVSSARAFLRSLPHVVETVQFGDNLVFWVGDKAIGGKMFAVVALDPDLHASKPVCSFLAGVESFAEMLETEGVIPAPYLARVHWVAATEWSTFNARSWQQYLGRAHALTLRKLPQGAIAVLALPPAQARRAIEDRRDLLNQRTSAKRVRLSAARSSPKKSGT